MMSDADFEVLLDTADVLLRYEGGEGGLVVHQAAAERVRPVLVPVDWEGAGPASSKLLLFSTSQGFILNVDVEIPGKLFVVRNPVKGLLGLPAVLGIALNAAINDVDGGPEPGLDTVLTVLTVRNPGSVYNVQHGWFRRLWLGVEPGCGGQVQPRGGHKVWVVQQQLTVTKHGL